MSSLNISHLTYISHEELATLLSSSPPPNIAVVDVRDSDHVGGHIRSSIWVPSSTLDFRVPELIRTLKDKEKVIFHCALSQQRGPSAALRYVREKERLNRGGPQQQILVLDGGFTKWQEKYGEDDKLTEGYVKDIWMN